MALVYLEHGRCGEQDGSVKGDRIWMTCAYKATISLTLSGSSPNKTAKSSVRPEHGASAEELNFPYGDKEAPKVSA